MNMNRNEINDLSKLAKAFFDNLEIDNCEFGGIGLDSKRPFGSSDVESDMLEIIGWQMEGNDGYDDCYSSEQRQYVHELYHQKLIPFLQKEWEATTPLTEKP